MSAGITKLMGSQKRQLLFDEDGSLIFFGTEKEKEAL